ncbi:MAG: isochorismate synthase [Cyanobacteriota bacterium]|nr:isochorismate synthase [Cyanobacteriota bacterium]
MPITPERTNFFQDCQELQQFLVHCQEISRRKKRSQFVSISWEVDRLDPLVIYQKLQRQKQLQFYIENPERATAIAALDSVTHRYIDSSERFESAREFIEDCWQDLITIGNLDRPFSGPHFFCSLTFFDRANDPDAPFAPATIFLPRWQISSDDRRSTIVTNLAVRQQTQTQWVARQIWHQLQRIQAIDGGISQPNLPKNHQWDLRDLPSFQTSVSSALESIDGDRFQKIVLSHAIDITASSPFEIVPSLARLRQQYRDCYIFSTSNGRGTHFIGASPERSIEIRDRQLTTDALAGSAPRGTTPTEDATFANQLLSSPKEQHEHQVVLDFTLRNLRELGLQPEPVAPMRLLQLSNIQHLWTPIRATVPPNIHPLQIVARLHPTPAVAGAPRTIACEEIRRYETFDRALYAAPLGWIDRRGNSEFVVGIRSALIEGCRARLYAGAGIVAGSDPKKELAEIQLKFQALLKTLVG